MLTQLSTVKARLAILPENTQYDQLLTNTLKAVSARFDRECRRTLARTVDFQQEFPADTSEIVAACYPVENVTRFELKTSETSGWVEQSDVEFLLQEGCVISLAEPLSAGSVLSALGRVTYTGGYLLPGAPAPDPPVPACRTLPDDLEQAAVEQVAFWFQTRDQVGVLRQWPTGGAYVQFADLELLPAVRAVLRGYERESMG